MLLNTQKMLNEKKIIPSSQNALFTTLRKVRAAKRNLTYPMSLPGSHGMSMPSFMPIGPKLWALEGYIHTVLLLLYRLLLSDYHVLNCMQE